MKRTEKRSKRIPRLLLLSFSIALIAFGLWFSGTNAYTFAKGYMLYKSGQAETETPLVQKASEPDGAELIESVVSVERPAVLYPERPGIGDEIGRLVIPKLGAALPIFHGTDEDELEKGVGHFADSVLPGENDNSVLSGHRDTVFRELGEVGKGDLLTVETSAGQFTYKVRQVRIVDEDDRTVIVPRSNAVLTVSTCYPFDFIGYAPERYILVANLIDSEYY